MQKNAANKIKAMLQSTSGICIINDNIKTNSG
ncbi:MAG: hypothetical protein K0S31_876 [Sphingobacterium multivorum]|jgi:hypothetical protein|nr:hypothetical protein [Sphingobacterium multivorum]